MISVFEVIGVLTVFYLGLKLCYVLGYTYELLQDEVEEENPPSLFQRVLTFVNLAFLVWITLPFIFIKGEVL